jgi:hypothetical protein
MGTAPDRSTPPRRAPHRGTVDEAGIADRINDELIVREECQLAFEQLQPGDYVKLRGGHGTDSHNVVYRDNCNFLWNNDKDTIYL